MTRKDLAKQIAKNTKLTSREAENLIISFGAVISEALSRKEKIIYSNFGTFYTVHYPSKVIYHPKHGAAKKMVMLPTDAVKWMPAPNIKKMVSGGLEVKSPTTHGRKKTGVSELIVDGPLTSKKSNPKTSGLKKEGIEEIPIRQEKTNFSNKETPLEEEQPPTSKTTNKTDNDKSEKINIYEELMGDGSKVESTFSDAIRVHKKPGFFGKIFGRKNTDDAASPPTKEDKKISSRTGEGIFDVNQKPKDPKPLDSIKTEKKPAQKTTNNLESDFFPQNQTKLKTTLSPINSQKPSPEADITPFSTKKNVSYVDLKTTTVSKELLKKIPEKIARQFKIVPVEENEEEMVIAMVDPEDIEAKEMAKKIFQKKISTRLATEEDINHILDQYSALESELKEAIITADEQEQESEEKKKVDKNQLIESASDNAPAAKIVSSLLKRAIREKASDIHVEPTEKEIEIRFRVDGILKKKTSLPKDIQSAIITRIKILSNMKIDEQRLPQDGRFSLKYDDRRIDFRISSLPVANGEKIVMRVLDRLAGIISIEKLGVRGSGLKTLEKNIEKSHGMILVTGPTGSGKTTTLYALIDKLFKEGVNIVTLEDPIEYQIKGINQSQVNSAIKYSFASGLRSIVRQDPDIIMLGEIRDGETAEMAVHAALTGHVMLSTLHTNTAAGATPRLLDMGIEPFLLTSSLNCVIGQRLARKICEFCKEEVKIPETEKADVDKEIAKLPPEEKKKIESKDIKFFKAKGCKECGDTGYKGRIGLFEVLEVSEEIKEMILKKESSSKIQEKACEAGMITMPQDGILKACDGLTTLEEVWRTTKE